MAVLILLHKLDGRRSPFFAYIATLPEGSGAHHNRLHLPVAWTDRELSWLQASELRAVVGVVKRQLRRLFTQLCALDVDRQPAFRTAAGDGPPGEQDTPSGGNPHVKGAGEGKGKTGERKGQREGRKHTMRFCKRRRVTFELYLWAYAVATSRAFHVPHAAPDRPFVHKNGTAVTAVKRDSLTSHGAGTVPSGNGAERDSHEGPADKEPAAAGGDERQAETYGAATYDAGAAVDTAQPQCPPGWDSEQTALVPVLDVGNFR